MRAGDRQRPRNLAAAAISDRSISWPPRCQASHRRPLAANQPSSAPVASGGQIGSRSPAVISTRVVTGAGSGVQGISGCISTAGSNSSGRAKITLARMLAPLE